MAGYTRQSTFTDGDIIQASDFNDEYNQLVNVFSTAQVMHTMALLVKVLSLV